MKAQRSLRLSDLAKEILFHGFWDHGPGFQDRMDWPHLHDPKSGLYPRKIGVFRPTPDHEETDHIRHDYRLFLAKNGLAALHIRYFKPKLTHSYYAAMNRITFKKPPSGQDADKRRKAMKEVTKRSVIVPLVYCDAAKLPYSFQTHHSFGGQLRHFSWFQNQGLLTGTLNDAARHLRNNALAASEDKRRDGTRKCRIKDDDKIMIEFDTNGVGNRFLQTLFAQETHPFAFEPTELENRVVSAVQRIPYEQESVKPEDKQIPLFTGLARRAPPWLIEYEPPPRPSN